MTDHMKADYDEEAQDDNYQKLNGSTVSDNSSTMNKKPRGPKVGVLSELRVGFIKKTYAHFSISVFLQLVYVIMISQTTLTEGDTLYDIAKNFYCLLIAITLALIATALVVS